MVQISCDPTVCPSESPTLMTVPHTGWDVSSYLPTCPPVKAKGLRWGQHEGGGFQEGKGRAAEAPLGAGTLCRAASGLECIHHRNPSATPGGETLASAWGAE